MILSLCTHITLLSETLLTTRIYHPSHTSPYPTYFPLISGLTADPSFSRKLSQMLQLYAGPPPTSAHIECYPFPTVEFHTENNNYLFICLSSPPNCKLTETWIMLFLLTIISLEPGTWLAHNRHLIIFWIKKLMQLMTDLILSVLFVETSLKSQETRAHPQNRIMQQQVT